jgi:hypothetical protein
MELALQVGSGPVDAFSPLDTVSAGASQIAGRKKSWAVLPKVASTCWVFFSPGMDTEIWFFP